MATILTDSASIFKLETAIEIYCGQRPERRNRSDLALLLEYVRGLKDSPQMLCDLRPHHIAGFRDYQLKNLRKAPSSVGRYLATVAAFMNFHQRTFRDFVSPMEGIAWPRTAPREPSWFTDDEVQALRDACADCYEGDLFRESRARLIIEFGLTIGMRLAEIRGTLMIDLSARLDRINIIGKGNYVETLPIPDTARDALLEYMQQREQRILASDRAFRKRAQALRLRYPLLVSTVGAMAGVPDTYLVDPKTIWRTVKHVGALAGIDGARTHRLRHSFVDRVYRESGRDLVLTKRAARHANINTTELYARRAKAEVEQVICKAGRLEQ